MTIGQVTISAADWLASRVSDRMALVAAQQRTDLTQQMAGKAVPPADEDAGAQLERRQRERSAQVAQESYRRIAARIKSRLASAPEHSLAVDPGSIRNDAGRAAMLENFRESPRIVASLIAADQKIESIQPVSQNQFGQRLDPLFAPVEAGLKKARAAQSVSPESAAANVEADAAANAQREQEDERARKTQDVQEPVFEKGLWDDLFVADRLTSNTPATE